MIEPEGTEKLQLQVQQQQTNDYRDGSAAGELLQARPPALAEASIEQEGACVNRDEGSFSFGRTNRVGGATVLTAAAVGGCEADTKRRGSSTDKAISDERGGARPQAWHCSDLEAAGAADCKPASGGSGGGCERMGAGRREERVGEPEGARTAEDELVRSSRIELASLAQQQQQEQQQPQQQEQQRRPLAQPQSQSLKLQEEQLALLQRVQQLPPQSDEWIQAGGSCEPPGGADGSCGGRGSGLLAGNWSECSTGDPNCYPITVVGSSRVGPQQQWPSSSPPPVQIASLAAASGPTATTIAIATTGQSQSEELGCQSGQLLAGHKQSQLEVHWTGPSLLRRVARFSGGVCDNSRSLCFRTSLVKSIKGKRGASVRGAKAAGSSNREGSSIGRAIKSLVGDFSSSFNDNSKTVQRRKAAGACEAAEIEATSAKRDSNGSVYIATSESEPLDKSSCKSDSSRGFLRASVSCQSEFLDSSNPRGADSSGQDQAVQQLGAKNAGKRGEFETGKRRRRNERESRGNQSAALEEEELNLDKSTIACDRSSSGSKHLPRATANMSSGGCVGGGGSSGNVGGGGGSIAKNKYLVEDKMRKQQQTAASTTVAAAATTTKCSGAARLEDRRPTYCSSVGATDMNYDSSFSSANNCSESNNTYAMIGQCSREFTDQQELTGAGNLNDCKRPSSNQCNAPNTNKPNKKSRANEKGIKKRENWDKNIEFLLAVIGFAVDLGNVWRFPNTCYQNGGGAFLIPYTIMFILGGLPIFYLEMSLGQYFSSGCLTVWKWVCPMAKGVGYAMCVLNFLTGLYYNTVISWAVFFFVESFTSVLPWTSCNNLWNSDDCRTIKQRQALKTNSTFLEQSLIDPAQRISYSSPTKDYFEREVLQFHLSKGIYDLGDIRKPLALYLAIVYMCIYFAIWKGVKSTGKAVWITALLPYFVLIPLLIRGVFLEGAWFGIKYYLYPEWIKLWDPNVWVEAAKQIYFSLGPGFGTLMALSSYNKFNHNCRRDALIAASVNYFASFISGLVIFAVLGYMATMENVEIKDVATEGPGLVFQVYPEGLATMSFSPMWSVLFFIMVITLGIDSTFGGLESVITGLCDEYPRVLRAHRSFFIGCLIILIYLCSLLTTTNGGNYVIYVLEIYSTLSLLFIVLIETIIVCWFYGADKFCRNLEEMYGEMPGAYWRICWKYVSPTILLIISSAACYQEYDKYHTLKHPGGYVYPGWVPILGLLISGSSVCCIPLYAIYYIKTKTSGTFLERLRIAIRPIEGDHRVEKEIYVDALTDKIRDENNLHLDTVI